MANDDAPNTMQQEAELPEGIPIPRARFNEVNAERQTLKSEAETLRSEKAELEARLAELNEDPFGPAAAALGMESEQLVQAAYAAITAETAGERQVAQQQVASTVDGLPPEWQDFAGRIVAAATAEAKKEVASLKQERQAEREAMAAEGYDAELKAFTAAHPDIKWGSEPAKVLADLWEARGGKLEDHYARLQKVWSGKHTKDGEEGAAERQQRTANGASPPGALSVADEASGFPAVPQEAKGNWNGVLDHALKSLLSKSRP